MGRISRIVVPAVAAVLTLAACGGAADSSAGNGLPSGDPTSDHGRIHVVAAESLWGDVVEQIGGSRVDVTSILDDPNQDPHEYESGVADAATISSADIVIVNGADYDPFMRRLIGADKDAKRTVVTVADVVHVKDGGNPHIWYDPARVQRAATAFDTALARKDPSHATRFSAGLAGFRKGEERVAQIVGEIRSKYRGTKVGYTEPVPGYLVTAAGLELGTPQSFSRALESGSGPGPGDSAHFEQAITRHTIKALLLNTQVTDPETDRLATLAKSSGVPVVSVSETKPTGQNFQTWQANQATALLEALGG